MRYYVIKEDQKFNYSPYITKWNQLLDVRNLRAGQYHKIPRRLILPIKESDKTIFTDVIVKPFFIVSEKVRDCLKLFEPNLKFKTFILLDKRNRKSEDYYLPLLTEIDCLSSDSIFNLDKSRLSRIEIELDQVGDKAIFRLLGVNSTYILIRLDVAESLLRRNTNGFLLEEVGCIKGGERCLGLWKGTNT